MTARLSLFLLKSLLALLKNLLSAFPEGVILVLSESTKISVKHFIDAQTRRRL